MEDTYFFEFVAILTKAEGDLAAEKKLEDILYRTAVNRLFYGVLHQLGNSYNFNTVNKNLWKDMGFHRYFIEKIRDSATSENLIKCYNRIVDYRRKADYDLGERFKKDDYVIVLNNAHEILSEIGEDSLITEHFPPELLA